VAEHPDVDALVARMRSLLAELSTR